MHGILYLVMKEYISRKDEICEELDLQKHFANCKRSFEAEIEGYDVLTVPSFENIIALAMGVRNGPIKAQLVLKRTS